MIAATVEQEVDTEAWNARVRVFPGGSIFQTTYWASYYTAYLGAQPHYLFLRDGKDIIGQLLILEMLRGHEALLGRARASLERLCSPLLKIFTWREGPLLADSCPPDEALQTCLRAVVDLARKRDVTGIEEVSIPLSQFSFDTSKAIFLGNGFEHHKRATIRIDVRRPLEQLWAGLKTNAARRMVRKGQKQDLYLRQIQRPEEIREFYQLVSAWRRQEGFPSYQSERYEKMATYLKDHCTFFLTQRSGLSIGGAGLWHFNGQAHQFTSIYSSLARQQRIYAGDFLTWEMIRWCHERGLSIFDLTGVSPSPVSAKEAGIRRFKEKWGGAMVEYPVFTYVLKPRNWNLVSFIQGAKQKIRKWRGGG